MIARPQLLTTLQQALRRSRVVALLGPRQCGKTTMARRILPPDSPRYFDLENPSDLELLEQPMIALAPLRGVVILDEIQRRPDLFPVLRVLADRRPSPARFLILGSASPALLRQSSESLAGRIETITMGGFRLDEVGAKALARHWRRGGFPPSYLARSEQDSVRWRGQFIQTFLERDLPQAGIRLAPSSLLRFWTMIAHYHGNIWNAAEPARSLGVSEPTVRQYLDLLTGFFMIRQLRPWHENLKKRQVKSPKIYFRDTGLLHQLLGIRDQRALLTHPKSGASWEGYVLEQLLERIEPDEAYFWATHGGAELDLLLLKDGKRFGFEIKYQDAPRLTPSMRTALESLKLQHLTVVYPGSKSYRLPGGVSVVPAQSLLMGKPHSLSRPTMTRS